jgi:single-stranded DNA-specific DHH superfamily exonuclease
MSLVNLPEKIKIYRTVFEDFDMDGMELRSIIKELQSIADANPDIEVVAECRESYSYCGVDMISQRFETDEEFETRMQEVKAKEESKEYRKRINALMKKSNLSTEEKDELIKFIQEK